MHARSSSSALEDRPLRASLCARSRGPPSWLSTRSRGLAPLPSRLTRRAPEGRPFPFAGSREPLTPHPPGRAPEDRPFHSCTTSCALPRTAPPPRASLCLPCAFPSPFLPRASGPAGSRDPPPPLVVECGESKKAEGLATAPRAQGMRAGAAGPAHLGAEGVSRGCGVFVEGSVTGRCGVEVRGHGSCPDIPPNARRTLARAHPCRAPFSGHLLLSPSSPALLKLLLG